ncbi:hypothetical protein FACS1894109_04630 [Spirochaetia bacterium]|nr:hypothetical protein FACS1894109_04630 [Spirochaetia bacterium]
MIKKGIAYAVAQKAAVLIAANSSGFPSATLYRPHRIAQTFHTTRLKTPPPQPDKSAFHAACLVANMKIARTIFAYI